MSVDELGEISYDLVRQTHDEKNRCAESIMNLRKLLNISSNSPESTYARFAWGHTIFITTSHPGIDDATVRFAIEKLRHWLTGYWLHFNRFPFWGTRGQGRVKTDPTVEIELARRFYLDVIEDPEDSRLNIPSIKNTTMEQLKGLSQRFDEWILSVGEDVAPKAAVNPRLYDFLAIDQQSLDELLALLEEIPPLRLAYDFAEKQKWKGDGIAHVWFFDSRRIRQGPDHRGSKARGWMRAEIRELPDIWFTREMFMGTERTTFGCYEEPEGSGDFYYRDELV